MMAVSTQTAEELIRSVFGPDVKVSCSNDAELLCQKNNLTFVEILEPFSKVTTEVKSKEFGGQVFRLKDFSIKFSQLDAKPYSQAAIYKKMNDIVSDLQYWNFDDTQIQEINLDQDILKINSVTPWFEAYRDFFFQHLPLMEHEFLKHHIACIFVVSSSNKNPIDQFVKMSQYQHLKKMSQSWFDANPLKFYVLLHDNLESDKKGTEEIYGSMKSNFGSSYCFLLNINSVLSTDSTTPNPWKQLYITKNTTQKSDQPETPLEYQEIVEVEVEDHADQIKHPLVPEPILSNKNIVEETFSTENKLAGACLSLDDHEKIKQFIHYFLIESLYPYMDKLLRNLNEYLLSKKGIHRSIVTATKRWFGGGKGGTVPNTASATFSSKSNTDIKFGQESVQIQMRQIADLAFLMQRYDTAYHWYHTVKREFSTESAWLHFAGAIEMAAISSFMQGNYQKLHYMDSALSTFLTSCRLQNAIRVTLFSTEILKNLKMHSEAASQFIQMTTEDSDLTSAMFLEQAAHSFMNMSKPMARPMARKYAFHMILSGHRYSKAGQRKHAIRCYSDALSVYKNKQWILAEDHINFTVGRQYFNLKELQHATEALEKLLLHESGQTTSQQSAFLKEYLFVFKQLLSTSSLNELPYLQIPIIVNNSTKILLKSRKLSNKDYLSEDEWRKEWKVLEENIILGIIQPKANNENNKFYSNEHLLSSTTIVGESVEIEFTLKNILKIPLILSDIVLIWNFIPTYESNDKTKSNEVPENNVNINVTKTFILGSSEIKTIGLSLTPLKIGTLEVEGFSYTLGPLSQASPSIHMTDIGIVQQGSGKKPSFISGINLRGKQKLMIFDRNYTKTNRTNILKDGLKEIRLFVIPAMPHLEASISGLPDSILSGTIKKVCLCCKNIGTQPLCNLYMTCNNLDIIHVGNQENIYNIPLKEGILNPDQSVEFCFWIRAPQKPGNCSLLFLFHYEYYPKDDNMTNRKRNTYLKALTNVKHSLDLTISSRILSKDIGVNFMEVSILNQHEEIDNIEFYINEFIFASIKYQAHLLDYNYPEVDTHGLQVSRSESLLVSFKLSHKENKELKDNSLDRFRFCPNSEEEILNSIISKFGGCNVLFVPWHVVDNNGISLFGVHKIKMIIEENH